MTATADPTIEFEIDAGQESMPLISRENPDKIWITDIRGRHWQLARMSVESFDEIARRPQMSTGETMPHVRGFPVHYCIRERVVWFWPIPSHKIKGGMSKTRT